MKRKKINEVELSKFVSESFFDKFKSTTEDLIKICRDKQANYVKSGAEEMSGVEFLSTFLMNGSISLKTYLAILPAVENYNSEYSLNINKRPNKIKNWLDDRGISYTELKDEVISVDINNLMTIGVFEEFNEFCYNLQKEKENE